jgi:hypothetical protein
LEILRAIDIQDLVSKVIDIQRVCDEAGLSNPWVAMDARDKSIVILRPRAATELLN